MEEAMAVAGTRGRRTVARGRAKAARRRAEVEPRANARRKSMTASTVETRETSGCCMRKPEVDAEGTLSSRRGTDERATKPRGRRARAGVRRRRAANEDEVDADPEEDSGRARKVCRGVRRLTSNVSESNKFSEISFVRFANFSKTPD